MNIRIVLILAAFASWHTATGCTSAIVSPRASADGSSILWKHRDNRIHCTCVEHVDDGNGYAYTALVNAYYSKTSSVYAGLNAAGFGIINTATRNLEPAQEPEYTATDTGEMPEYRNSLMCDALRECVTTDDFERMLRHRPRPADFRSNIGVADSHGGAAYFEVWSGGYRRYDTDATECGYDVRANFSFAGDNSKRGSSVGRYDTVCAEMSRHHGKFSPADFIGYSRSFFSARCGDILGNDKPYGDLNLCVPRYCSVASIVIVCGKHPRMLVINGHPVSGAAVPVWVESGKSLPKCLGCNGEMYRLSREFVARAYDGKLLNKEVVRRAMKICTNIPDPESVPTDTDAFYRRIDKLFARHAARMRKILQTE